MVQGLSILNPIPLRVWGIFLGDNMNKDYITKVSDIVGTDCKRPDLVGKSIVIYDNDKKHCYNRHYKDFENPKDFSFVMNNLGYIIDEEIMYL